MVLFIMLGVLMIYGVVCRCTDVISRIFMVVIIYLRLKPLNIDILKGSRDEQHGVERGAFVVIMENNIFSAFMRVDEASLDETVKV